MYCLVYQLPITIEKYKYKSSCICLSYILLVIVKYKYKSSCICLSGGAVIWQGLWRPAGHPHLRANPLKMIRLKHQQKETSTFKGKSTFKLNFEDGSQQKETLRLYDMSSQDDSQIIRTHLYANPLIKGVAHHLLDQQEEVAPFQGSRILSACCGLAGCGAPAFIHQKRILEEHYFCSARGLVPDGGRSY